MKWKELCYHQDDGWVYPKALGEAMWQNDSDAMPAPGWVVTELGLLPYRGYFLLDVFPEAVGIQDGNQYKGFYAKGVPSALCEKIAKYCKNYGESQMKLARHRRKQAEDAHKAGELLQPLQAKFQAEAQKLINKHQLLGTAVVTVWVSPDRTPFKDNTVPK